MLWIFLYSAGVHNKLKEKKEMMSALYFLSLLFVSRNLELQNEHIRLLVLGRLIMKQLIVSCQLITVFNVKICPCDLVNETVCRLRNTAVCYLAHVRKLN